MNQSRNVLQTRAHERCDGSKARSIGTARADRMLVRRTAEKTAACVIFRFNGDRRADVANLAATTQRGAYWGGAITTIASMSTRS
jgi:hypothetical protein